MSDRTITVAGHFGDKQVTKEQFVGEWSSHMRELNSLSWDHMEEFAVMRGRVEEIAADGFERVYAAQNKEPK